jgi:RHS repeat-associated protein
MAEQHSQTADYDNRWKFTGHELDRETGLYYAGARYYDPKVSIWLSVDPLAEKYPNWNPYNYVMQNPINLIDPTGMEAEGDPHTNSQQVNSEIDKILKEHPNAPIYLLVQSDTGEGRDRQKARGGNIGYDVYTIQDQSNNPDTDYTNGSFFVTVQHGKGLITGGNIETSSTNEINASFSLSFVGAQGVGGADQLTDNSTRQISSIVAILNSTNQNVSISSNSILTGDSVGDPNTTQARGLMNGTVGSHNVVTFGNTRIDTVINSLMNAGANMSGISRGSVNIFSNIDINRRDGTFIDFRFSSPILQNANWQNSSGTINLNKGKLQIF